MNPFILVVGGAGYIGAQMARQLATAGYTPVVLDDLSNGRREAAGPHRLVVADMGDSGAVDALLQAFEFDAVMHFAGFIQVGESVAGPGPYYDNNVGNTIRLLQAMLRHKVGKCIFSSTAAIFGDPQYVPIDEGHPKEPINPYGRSKWMVEQVLADFDHAYGCVRAACATSTPPAPTPASRWGSAMSPRLGNGAGYSMLEVIKAAERVTGRTITRTSGPRRAGDPPVLVADAALAKSELDWSPRFADLDTIILHAWRWEQKRSGPGYAPAGTTAVTRWAEHR